MLGEMISGFRVIAAAYDPAGNVIAIMETQDLGPKGYHVAQLVSKDVPYRDFAFDRVSLRTEWQIVDDSQTCWITDEQTVWEEFGNRTA